MFISILSNTIYIVSIITTILNDERRGGKLSKAHIEQTDEVRTVYYYCQCLFKCLECIIYRDMNMNLADRNSADEICSLWKSDNFACRMEYEGAHGMRKKGCSAIHSNRFSCIVWVWYENFWIRENNVSRDVSSCLDSYFQFPYSGIDNVASVRRSSTTTM